MKNYLVTMERRGRFEKVGRLFGDDSSAACFAYTEDYLRDPAAVPISVSLPLQAESFSPARTKSFFEGLLPEGFTRRAVAGWMRADEDDYLALLYGLGRECLGALRITREDEPELPDAYEPLSLEQVEALAAEGTSRSAELVTRSHLSLTGASGKVGLYLDEQSGKWYQPSGTAPSTHIVKQSHVRLRGIVPNEQLVQMTAAKLGIDVPESRIINLGSGRDEEVLLATRRYDRIFLPGAGTVGALPRPLRLHQEDLAQALGIPAAAKYERDPEQGYLRQLFLLLRRVSADPIADQLKLWDRIVFSYLVGNTDSHIKNLSLLYGPEGKGIRLAPAYDLLSTAVYESSTRDMAFSIGGKYSLDEIRREDFRPAARQAGIGERLALRRFDDLKEKLPEALRSAAGELLAQGFAAAPELAETILRKGGIAKCAGGA